MKLITRIASTVLLIFSLAACSIVGGAAPEPECSITYDLRDPAGALGSEASFHDAAHAAQVAGVPTTLAEITSAAGWTGSWDRVVFANVDMPPRYLAESAGTPTACWLGVPTSDYLGERSEGYYAFLSGETLVQTVHWTRAEDQVVRFGDEDALHPDTPLVLVSGLLFPS